MGSLLQPQCWVTAGLKCVEVQDLTEADLEERYRM